MTKVSGSSETRTRIPPRRWIWAVRKQEREKTGFACAIWNGSTERRLVLDCVKRELLVNPSLPVMPKTLSDEIVNE